MAFSLISQQKLIEQQAVMIIIITGHWEGLDRLIKMPT